MGTISEINKVALVGRVASSPMFSHKSYGEAFYIIALDISRKSGYEDKIRIIVSEKLLRGKSPKSGRYIEVMGQIRTYNRDIGGRNKLDVFVFAKSISYCSQSSGERFCENYVELEGFICKPPVRRSTPLGREICDLMIAVNREYNRSDYVPVISWGNNAFVSGALEVGQKLRIVGRIQSREYLKHGEDGTCEVKTAYEVSACEINAL